jgi:hypothetical protein
MQIGVELDARGLLDGLEKFKPVSVVDSGVQPQRAGGSGWGLVAAVGGGQDAVGPDAGGQRATIPPRHPAQRRPLTPGPGGSWPHPAARTAGSADPCGSRGRSGPAAVRPRPTRRPRQTTAPGQHRPPRQPVTTRSAGAARRAGQADRAPAPGAQPGPGTARPAGHGHRRARPEAAPGQD